MYNAELLSGMTQVDFMSRLAAMEDLTEVVAKLKTIASIVLKQPSLRLAVTCGEAAVSANENALKRFVSSLPTDAAAPSTTATAAEPVRGFHLDGCNDGRTDRKR